MRNRRLGWSVGCGLALAALYTVSPVTIWVSVASAALWPLFQRDLPINERRWLTVVVGIAIALRIAVIAGVFISNLPNHDVLFAGAMSGDEGYTMSRALRVREIVRGAPISLYGYVVAFDEYGRSSYVTAATVLQVIAGPTPYALRLLNTLLFTLGALLLFRLSRRSFGFVPALAGLAAVLGWPSLFAWSISLLKESLYFLLGAGVLAGFVALLRGGTWRARLLAFLGVAASAGLMQGLRPGAIALAAAGVITGCALRVALLSRRTVAASAAIAVVTVALVIATPALNARVIGALEGTAKTHAGHVFTVGHDYKLLDAGFYLNPQPAVSSTLSLTADQAARYVIRALVDFVVVPTPWQLRSTRELAYLPEQIAWYALIALLPIGLAAGYRRDPLVTCLLAGYVVPTALALALTNGNVGTLLRLRGLVTPFLVWLGAVGFCAVLQGPDPRPQKEPMTDHDRRLFGLNPFDAAVGVFVLLLIPIAYGTFLLFREPTPRITSVDRVPITQEERRLAGGNPLTAKLKIRGSGLRPMLQAGLGGTRMLGFIFENPNSADVMVGVVPPGTHDLILYDGVQEVARLPRAVVIEAPAATRVSLVGAFTGLDRATADALSPAAGAAAPATGIITLGAIQPAEDGRWQRPAEIIWLCDPDPNAEGCHLNGFALARPPWPALKVDGPGGKPLAFSIAEVLPASPPVPAIARVRLTGTPELLRMVRSGDRDLSLDTRAAVVVESRGLGGAGGGWTSPCGLALTPRPTGGVIP